MRSNIVLWDGYSTSISNNCSSVADDVFGPQVATCRRSFDFTLLFEESILSIGPSIILLLIAPLQVSWLARKKTKVGGGTFQKVKLLVLAFFALLQLALLIASCITASKITRASIATTSLSLVVACVLCLLSYVEHAKTIRPSALLSVYLFFSLIFDAVRVRTLWLSGLEPLVTRLFTASVGLKLVILLLEARRKTSYLSSMDRSRRPEETSGIFSHSLFWWVNGLVWQGFRQALQMTDLYPLDEAMSSEPLRIRFEEFWHATEKRGSFSLAFSILRTLKFQVISPIFPRLVLLAFTFCQPLLVNRLLNFLGQPDTVNSTDTGYGLIGAYGLVYLGLAISTGFYNHQLYRLITMVRGILVLAIYRKTTQISITALDNSAAVTLMSADVERIVQALRLLHEIWVNLLSTGIAIFLLQRQLGGAAAFPAVIAIAAGSCTFALSPRARSHQLTWIKKIQERVGITSTMLSSMKGVKMSGLTGKLAEVIQSLRLNEILAGRAFRFIQIYMVALAYIPTQLSSVVTFAAFTGFTQASGKTLNASRLFTSLSILQLLTSPFVQTFQSVPVLMAAWGCVQRIQKYLLTESRSDHRLEASSLDPRIPQRMYSRETSGAEIEMEDFKRSSSDSTHQAGSEVLSVRNATFGWSEDAPVLQDISFGIQRSQLTLIIGPIASGKSTLLKAILGETKNSKGFVYVSTTDIAFADQTPWLTNSTIQKNIIGFSAFDESWYQNVIHASCLQEDLVTLIDGDQSVIGSAGITLSGGQKQRVAIARAVYARKQIAIFDDVFSSFDKMTERKVFDRVFGSRGLLRRLGTTIVLATHSPNLLPYADRIITLLDGKITEKEKLIQSTFNGEASDDSIDSEPQREETARLGQAMKERTTKSSPEQDNRNRGDFSVYRYYFRSIGLFNTVVFFSLQTAYAFLSTFPNVWLKWWSDSNAINPGEHLPKYLGVYAMLQVLGIISLAVSVWHALLNVFSHAGAKLHRIILDTVMAAPMSFFSMTDTGTTINRFSQDISVIDSELLLTLFNTIIFAFGLIGSAGLVASSSSYAALAFPPIAVVFYFLQKYYLRTSRQLRFMDLEAKSPLYSQFLETLSGLTTIRAFQWQEHNHKLNNELLDASQQPFYLLFMVQRWLTLVLDLVGAGLAVFVVALAIKFKSTVSLGFTGVALVNLITFTDNIKNLIIVWTMLETSIGAVSRIRGFEAETVPENLPGENNMPPADWPTSGEMEIRGLSASYKSDSELVLDNVSLHIKGGEKIGIVGRSGSGKSSLILALARMIELSSGIITIDSLDITHMPRQTVRSCLNIIPQDPYFLYGTIRLNLDPHQTASDQQITDVLKRAQLWDVIEGKGGLETKMDVDFLSHGQRQLFCLVRAMLHLGKILILDEATSSVDLDTDFLMQRIIREDFADHTIIAIAHRIDTVLDFDRVVVMDKGKVTEFDNPTALLARKSAFRDLFETFKERKEEAVEE